MRKSYAAVLYVVLTIGLCAHAVKVHAGSSERQSAINGADATQHYAVVAPTFLGNGTGPQSYIRLFSGAGAAGSTSTFNVTVVGTPSGQVYGKAFTIAVPYFASPQFSIQTILSLAGAGSFTGGDTGYSVYLQNSDAEAGYQHAVYDWTTNLFENLSNCSTPLNQQMKSLHKELVLVNVHTSKVGGGNFPSTLVLHNYSNAAATYTLSVYNGGGVTTSGALQADSGKQTCSIAGNTVAANSSLSIPESTIEANSACVLDSDESYFDIAVSDPSGATPSATLTHLIHVASFNGNVNLTDVCAVNNVATGTSGTTTQPSTTIDGKSIYTARCAACHDIAPIFSRSFLATLSKQTIIDALTSGPMQSQAAGLSAAEIQAVATYLTDTTAP